RTIDYDAVAYRTGVILAEDPGEPNEHVGVTKLEVNNSWEFIKWNQKNPNSTTGEGGVKRFGLTPYKSIPRILALKKIESFGDTSIYNSIPQDYRDRIIFGNHSYYITISKLDGTRIESVGDPVYPQNTGYIRRVVMVKTASEAAIDMDNYVIDPAPPAPPAIPNRHFYVYINNSEMIDIRKGPVYWIDPMREELRIRIHSPGPFPVPVPNVPVTFSYWDEGDWSAPRELKDEDGPFTSIDASTDPEVLTVIPAGYFIGKFGVADKETNIRIQYDFNVDVLPGVSYMDRAMVSPLARPQLVPAILEVRIW
ncbi:MAG: hypothetical protein WCK53_16330, partial [Methanomicrobiales archaeon]